MRVGGNDLFLRFWEDEEDQYISKLETPLSAACKVWEETEGNSFQWHCN